MGVDPTCGTRFFCLEPPPMSRFYRHFMYGALAGTLEFEPSITGSQTACCIRPRKVQLHVLTARNPVRTHCARVKPGLIGRRAPLCSFCVRQFARLQLARLSRSRQECLGRQGRNQATIVTDVPDTATRLRRRSPTSTPTLLNPRHQHRSNDRDHGTKHTNPSAQS